MRKQSVSIICLIALLVGSLLFAFSGPLKMAMGEDSNQIANNVSYGQTLSFTLLSYSPSPASVDSNIVCTVTISGTTPTGTIRWTTTSPSGRFSSTLTPLISGGFFDNIY
jgi:hypothetical protein